MSLVSSSLLYFQKNFDMFVWTSGFQKSLAHTDFNMFVDEWTSANESPGVFTNSQNSHALLIPLISSGA